MDYKGASVLDGVFIHHFRCRVNPSAHHRAFALVGGRWHEVKER
jgi:hypothetical protein